MIIEATTELLSVLVASVQSQASFRALLAAWWSLYIARNCDPNAPIPYRLT